MTTIYWGASRLFEGQTSYLSLLIKEPEAVLPQIIKARDTSNARHFTKCPAFQDYYKNTFVIRSPIDITLNYDASNKFLSIHPQGQEFYNATVLHRANDVGYEDAGLFSLGVSYLFIADKDCLIELLPVSMHDNPNASNFRVITGTFNISKWFRPVEFSFELLTSTMRVNQGDPLFYVRFVPQDGSKVVLKHKEYTDEEEGIALKCGNVKVAQPKLPLQQMYKLTKRLVPELWFNKKRCPFKFPWGK